MSKAPQWTYRFLSASLGFSRLFLWVGAVFMVDSHGFMANKMTIMYYGFFFILPFYDRTQTTLRCLLYYYT